MIFLFSRLYPYFFSKAEPYIWWLGKNSVVFDEKFVVLLKIVFGDLYIVMIFVFLYELMQYLFLYFLVYFITYISTIFITWLLKIFFS